MRTEAYVNRLISATKERNPDVRKIARMLELTLSKVTQTPAGSEALKLVQTKIVKEALKHSPLFTPESEEVRAVPKPQMPIEVKRRRRTYRFEQ